MEKYSFTIPAKPFMGKFFFPPSWLRHSGQENPIPNSLQMRNSSFPYVISGQRSSDVEMHQVLRKSLNLRIPHVEEAFSNGILIDWLEKVLKCFNCNVIKLKTIREVIISSSLMISNFMILQFHKFFE